MIKKNTNIIALIPAKKNSRGLKNKNLKKLNKLSLVELAILGAKKSKLIDKIYLSSDSDRILDIGAKLNIDVIKRKKILSTSSALANTVILDFIKNKLNSTKEDHIIVYLFIEENTYPSERVV